MKRLFDLRHSMFRPVWARVLAVAIIVAWTGVEVANGAVAWAVVFGAAAAFMAWSFFVRYRESDHYDP